MSYLPHTDADRKRMLEIVGVDSVEGLFEVVPEEQRYPRLNLPPPLSEMEVAGLVRELAERNAGPDRHPSFLGSGAYRHFLPAVVDHILRRGEFYSAYTPYQAEASQGTLTAMYEYQTMICELTGMDVANASLYDGASAVAEAALMAARVTRRDKIVVARTVHPACRRVLRTYTQGLELKIEEMDYSLEGNLDLDKAEGALSEEVACLLVQHPNSFGCLEEVQKASELAHQHGALLVVSADPIALGLFKSPGEEGADIVVGEGQPLGTPTSFGGPYLGFMACREAYLRQLPGRLVGMTTDTEGRRGFVLTLQAREQHIRRERATSNICSNEALVALAATVYLAMMGKAGLRQVAELCFHKAHYAASRLRQLKGYRVSFGEFFKEFVVRTPVRPQKVNARLWRKGILGGHPLGVDYPELSDGLLLCVTEMNTKAQIDSLVDALGEVK